MSNKPLNSQKTKTKASDMLILVILSYLSLQIQPLVNYLIVWTPLIDNLPLRDKLWTLILNLVCILAWVGLAAWFMKLSRTECDYNVTEKCERPSNVRLYIAAGISVVFTALMVIFAGGISLPYQIGGVMDVVYTLAYYVFLIFNAAMFVLVIAFGQKMGDVAFGDRNIPWGGIALGTCMAVSNIVSGISQIGEKVTLWMVLLSALVVLAYALIYGAIYVAVGKKPIYALPFVAFIFILL